jgi:hypothetical protein
MESEGINLVNILSITGLCFIVKKLWFSQKVVEERNQSTMTYKTQTSDMGVNNGSGGVASDVMGNPVAKI